MTVEKLVVDKHISIHLTMMSGTPITYSLVRINSQLTVSIAFLISIFKAHLDIRLAK
jgi:hypothetical protein